MSPGAAAHSPIAPATSLQSPSGRTCTLRAIAYPHACRYITTATGANRRGARFPPRHARTWCCRTATASLRARHVYRFPCSVRNYCVKRHIVIVTIYPIPAGWTREAGCRSGFPRRANKACRKRSSRPRLPHVGAGQAVENKGLVRLIRLIRRGRGRERPRRNADRERHRRHGTYRSLIVRCRSLLPRAARRTIHAAQNDAKVVISSSADQIATRTPSSTTRSEGMRKNSVAGTALRASTRNSHSRHSGIFGAIAGTITSRPRK
jgi:hypothetical protein